MRWIAGIPASIVVIAVIGCSSSPSTRPSAVETGQGAAIPAWLKVATAAAPTSAVRSSAVIDGFRVHPDPGDDGVIHVFDDENVVVNATDIASRPPAEPNYLVVNWGDGPNQRVGCGPCRQDHAYGPGRYTLVASLDGSGRSISVQVQVSARGPRRVRSDGPIQPFDLTNGDIGVGDTTYLVVPLLPPPTIELPVFLSIDCSPTDAADIDFLSPPLITDSTLGLPFIGVTPGTCTVSVTGTLVDGSPFAQSVTFSVH